MMRHPGKHITIHEVGSCVGEARLKSMTPMNITSAFRKCGIYPFADNLFTEDFMSGSITYRSAPATSKSSSATATSASATAASSCATATSATTTAKMLEVIKSIQQIQQRKTNKEGRKGKV